MIESKGHKITPIDGDLAVSRNAEIGGDADIHGKARVAGSMKVEGFLDAPNIKGAVKGLFATEEELKREYPNPRPGWCAIVLADDESGFLYLAKNREWEKQSEEAKPFDFIVDSINVFASKGELEEVNQGIINETTRATDVENDIRRKALKADTVHAEIVNDSVKILGKTLDGDGMMNVLIPAATETKAGVVSAEDKKNFIKSFTWNNDTDPSNMNDFVTAGVYDIKGERKRTNDNLPILNANPGHSFNARLTVLDSSIPGDGKNDDKCITQVLSFSNRLGQGEVYIRTGKGSSLDSLTWEKWSTLQRNVNVDEVGSLDDLKDNGIYSGVWLKGHYNTHPITFVCIVINDYFIGTAPRRISQFVYGLSKFDGSVVYQSRVWDDSKGRWGDWDILNKNEITSMISAEIKKVTDGIDPEKIDSIKDIVAWIEAHGGDVTAIYNAIQQNTVKINAEISRAKDAEQTLSDTITENVENIVNYIAEEVDTLAKVDDYIKSSALGYDRQTPLYKADKVTIKNTTLDGKKEHSFDISAATPESAGVMSAEDKVELAKATSDISDIRGTVSATFDFTTGSTVNYANRKFAYNFKAGNKYLLKVLTEDTTSTTYFSFRQDSTAIQNNLLNGTGKRENIFTCTADCNYLYMSIENNGVAVVYDVEILNLSKYSIGTLVRDDITRDARIDDLTRTLLKLPTTDDFVEGKRLIDSGNIAGDSNYSVTEKYFYIPAKTKVNIRGRAYTDHAFVCVYDIDYKLIHRVAGQGGETDVEYILEYDYPTYIRIATPTSKISDFSISYDGESLWQDVSNMNSRVTSVENAAESFGKPNTLNYEDFEIGYIGIDRTGWSYRDDTDSRVRMKAGITYHLFVGDVVKLPDGVRAYLGFRVGNTYDFKSWVTNEFTIVTEGDYKILLSGVSESTLSSKFDLLSGVSIVGGERRYGNTLPIDADALATMRVINHRGFNSEAPENTLPAFELSKLKGFRYVEADIRFTADGVAVCLHDDTVDRTSNGSGRVGTMTLEELRALDFGSWFSADYAGVQIPTFEEFILLCKQLGLKPYIELKTGTAEQIKQLFDLVRLYGMEKHSTFMSYDLSILQLVIANSDKVRVGLLADTYSEEYLNKLISLKGEKRDVFANLNGNNITDDGIITIRQNGCDVESYTAPWKGFIFKVDGVTTDTRMYWDYSGSCSVWRSKTNGWKE